MTPAIDPIESGDPLLTIDQASEYLQIPKATLYTWRTRRKGYGPRAVTFGKLLRYRRSDLDLWIQAHLEAHAEPAPADVAPEVVPAPTAQSDLDDDAA